MPNIEDHVAGYTVAVNRVRTFKVDEHNWNTEHHLEDERLIKYGDGLIDRLLEKLAEYLFSYKEALQENVEEGDEL